MELDEQGRHHLEVDLGIGIEGLHMLFIDEFDPRHRDAELDGLDHRLAGGIDGGKRADPGGDRFGDAIEPHPHFGDDAERSLRPHQQAG